MLRLGIFPEQLDSFAEAIFKAEVEEAAERGGVTVPELRRGLSADFAAVPSAAAGLGGYLFLESQLPGIQESAAQRDQYQRAVPPSQRRNPDRDRAREIERTLSGAREQGATDRSQEFKQWVESKGIPYENALAQVADYYSFTEEGNRAVLNNPDEAPPILLDWYRESRPDLFPTYTEPTEAPPRFQVDIQRPRFIQLTGPSRLLIMLSLPRLKACPKLLCRTPKRVWQR